MEQVLSPVAVLLQFEVSTMLTLAVLVTTVTQLLKKYTGVWFSGVKILIAPTALAILLSWYLYGQFGIEKVGVGALLIWVYSVGGWEVVTTIATKAGVAAKS